MAEIPATYDRNFTNHQIVSWTSIVEGDTAEVIEIPKYSDKTVHVFGTFGGATITVQGSNDPLKAAWVDLVDPQGNALTFTSAGMETILDNPVFLRWTITGGAGSDLSVILSSGKTL